MADVRDLVRVRLERAGHEIVGEATTGREAIGVVAALTPDVVVLDVMMPEMTGLEALPDIVKVSPESKVLMFSSLEHLNLTTVRHLGGHALLAKVDQSRLADEVGRLCGPDTGSAI
jgi:chemotaxis response regulator CheB